MKAILILVIAALGIQLTNAQDSTSKVDMVSSNWNINDKTTFEEFDDRKTLVLNGGRITVKDQKFTNGTIEVDIYANSKRSFAGITFRKQNDNMEEVYMRLHKSKQADAVQYTPIFNNESNWQLYREHQAMVSFKNTGWNTLRLDVSNNNAEVFVNDEKVMHINHLRTGNTIGEVGLFALFTNRFSNFRIRHNNEVKDEKKENINNSENGVITQWEITEAKLYKEEELDYNNFLKEKYIRVNTEKSGLLPISKHIRKTSSGRFEKNNEDYTIASITVNADQKETKLFSFDYSDKIIVYLNGKIIFKGNNAFRAKGMQYTGHIDINANKLYLPLERGVNKIHCVVIDKANGWGIIAKLE